ncbi:hypothetical protein R3W88_011163 [Solanum pinnatisectum]|uniref:Cytochrome P450 n=1 Tax=Solanum pinnatisectum TaxID=50273 RepID=A0AAV9L7W3_9SOLN|nr:hypothetical protein R3W88_011163 [Solanum pinnatisectum]
MFPSLLMHIHRIHERSTGVLSRTGGTFLLKGLWFTNMDFLGTVDLANVHYIMSANFTNFPKGHELKKIFDVIGDGIFNSDLDLWKNQRKLAREMIIHQRFHKCLVKTNVDKVENGLIPVLEFVAKEGRVLDLQDVFKRITFDTTCMLLTGFDPECLALELADVPFLKAMDDAKDVCFIRHLLPESVWKLQQWLGFGSEKKLSKAEEVLDQVIGKYISMKRDELSNAPKSEEDEEGYDLLTSCMVNDAETKTGQKFDDKFLRDTILNFMFVGHDTVASGLTWFIWLVVAHPEIEKKIREELKAMVLLYPPVAIQHKTPLEPDILPSGHHVHSNMRPERWISDRGTVKHEPSYKFFSFNAGARTCLAKEVLFTQMKIVASTIIHNYQIEMVKGHTVCPNISAMLYMKHGFKVRIKRR